MKDTQEPLFVSAEAIVSVDGLHSFIWGGGWGGWGWACYENEERSSFSVRGDLF